MSSQPTKTDGQIAASTVVDGSGVKVRRLLGIGQKDVLFRTYACFYGPGLFADIPNVELRRASGRAVSNALRQDWSSESPPAN